MWILKKNPRTTEKKWSQCHPTNSYQDTANGGTLHALSKEGPSTKKKHTASHKKCGTEIENTADTYFNKIL